MQTCGRRGILLALPAAVLQNQSWHGCAPITAVQGENLMLVIFQDPASCQHLGGMIPEQKPHITSQSIQTLTLGYKKVVSLSLTQGLGHDESCFLPFLLSLLRLQTTTEALQDPQSVQNQTLPPVSKAHELIMGYCTFKNSNSTSFISFCCVYALQQK